MTATTTRPVGFVGLGNIGGPMATHLLDWPGGLLVCDLDDDVVAPLVDGGAKRARSAAEMVVDGAGVICVMVQTEAQVRDVVLGEGGVVENAPEGTVVVIHSTIGPDTAADIAEAAAPAGVALVEAPVSGGIMGAYEGNLAVMLGGDDDAVALAVPVVERFAELVVHCGPLGSATTMKLARNLVTFVSYVASGEALRLAAAAGLDLQDLGAIVRHTDAVTGGPGAVMVRDSAGPMGEDDPMRGPLEHAFTLGSKDLELAVALGRDLGVDIPATALAHDELARALGLG